MKRNELTVKDLLAIDAHGFGYLGHSARLPETWAHMPDPYACARALDEAVVEAANHLGWSREQLAAWADGREGRYFGDSLNPRYLGQIAAAKFAALRAMRS